MRGLLASFSLLLAAVLAVETPASADDPAPPDATYRRLPFVPFSEALRNDTALKPAVMERQRALLGALYDLSDRPIEGVMMSGGRTAVHRPLGDMLQGGGQG